MAEGDFIAGSIDTVIADYRRSANRLKKKPIDSWEALNNELVNNVYPSLIMLAEQQAETIDIVDEMADHHDSYIQPDVAEQIFTTVALGSKAAEFLRAQAEALDDLAKKKLLSFIDEFERSLELTTMTVASITVTGDDDDGDDDDGDEDNDNEEDDDSSEGEEEEKEDTVAKEEGDE